MSSKSCNFSVKICQCYRHLGDTSAGMSERYGGIQPYKSLNIMELYYFVKKILNIRIQD